MRRADKAGRAIVLAQLQSGWLVLAVLAFVALTSCAKSLRPDAVHASARPGAPRVVILQSSAHQMFEGPVAAFVSQMDADVSVFTRAGEIDPKRLDDAVRRIKPDLIFALGTKATLLARERFKDTPILFAMVMNHRRHELDGNNLMGVALELPASYEFLQFKMIIPDLKRVLAFYVPSESAELVATATEDLKNLGIELVAVPVSNLEDVPAAYAKHATRIDGLWLLNDAILMNPETFEFLRHQAIVDKIPLLSSFSAQLAEKGALMAVSPDLTSLGGQAASMARAVVEQHQLPSTIGVQPPIGAHLAVNMVVARTIGVRIPDDARPLINRLIDR